MATKTNSPIPPKPDPFDWPHSAGLSRAFKQEVNAQLRQKKKRRKRAVMVGAATLSLLFLFGWLMPFLQRTDAIATRQAQRSTLALVDGSRAELNAGTRLTTDFRYGRRAIRLEHGEVFFTVAADPEHPFVVTTPAGTIRVIGTQFNVSVAERGVVTVTLIEGSVSLSDGTSTAIVLTPGQQRQGGNPPRDLSTADLERVTAWRTGKIILDGLTVAEAAGAYAAFHGRTITVASEVSHFQMGGSGPIDNLPAFFSGLEEAMPVRVISRGDGAYHIAPR